MYELPASVAAPQIDLVHPEYPSAAFLDETVVFIGDGRGSLYVLDIPISGPATLLASFELLDKVSTVPRPSIPFRVHNVIKTSDTTTVALLSSRHYGGASDPSAKHPMKYHEFDVWAARFTLPFEMQLESLALDIVWRRRGEDVPMLMTYHRARNAYFLLGSSPYRKISDPHAAHYDPSPDEIAPIPRPEESLDSEGPPQPTKPYPYSWTQTSDVVTVAFPLPSSTTACQIRVTFSQKTLTVHVMTPSGVEGFGIPHYSAKQLWDGIRPSTSLWTWDREGDHEFGILAIHLDKQNEGTKWPHVFAASGTSSSAQAEDTDVPETIDPSELYAIRESLEKYTTALREGEDASGLGLGRGLPTLAQGEMDEEVDSSVGRLAFVTWVGEDGSSPGWSASLRDSAFNVLSTPLPGTGMGPLSLVVKNGLDGTRHVLSDDPADGGSPAWKHENTFSALAFVLASKRDTRFTYHASDTIFAFENGTQDRGGNVYVYRSSSPKELWARQSVLTVGQGDGGSLLGIGAFTSGNETGNTIICLCENELVILRNVH